MNVLWYHVEAKQRNTRMMWTSPSTENSAPVSSQLFTPIHGTDLQLIGGPNANVAQSSDAFCQCDYVKTCHIQYPSVVSHSRSVFPGSSAQAQVSSIRLSHEKNLAVLRKGTMSSLRLRRKARGTNVLTCETCMLAQNF